mgnify:CR=1 FL=1
MKKLLFIVEAFGGGIFTYISDLANTLSDEYEVYIAYSLRKETPKDFKNYFNSKITLIPVNNFTREISVKKDIKAMLELKKIVNEIAPDMIHLHSSKAGVLGRMAFLGRKRPMFYTPHGYSFFMPNISKKKRLMYKEIEKLCSLSRCVTIACSKSEYEASLGITSNSEYVNNGINMKNLDKMITAQEATKGKKLKIATLGRIAYQKNPELFDQIAKAFPNDEFVWIGDGDLKDKLSARNISITGWLDRRSAIKKMEDSDVFLLTSRYEGLPMSLLEAMYMKKVCVVSAVVGNRDVINAKNGFLCSDLNEYIGAINKIKSEDTKKLVQQARADILSEYNTEVMAEKYKEIYRKYSLDQHLVHE